jgi:hypothetical protein
MMNKRFKEVATLIVTLAFSSSAFSNAPKVKEENDIYAQKLSIPNSSGSIAYFADSKTEICFMKWLSSPGESPTPPVVIDCADLAKRDEWKKVLTWVN